MSFKWDKIVSDLTPLLFLRGAWLTGLNPISFIGGYFFMNTAMFPMGGATVVAIRMGRGDRKGANHAFMTAFSLTLLMSAVLMAVGMVFSQQIVDLSGARKLSAELRQMSAL